MKKEDHNDYKVVISELKSDPFRVLNAVFVLMTIIPLLAVFYLIIKEQLLQQVVLGHNGSIAAIGILISVIGFLYAYILVRNLVTELLQYAQERKFADDGKTEVVLAVTHDLKNPLTILKLSLDNLMEGVGGALNSAHTGIVKMCLSNVERLFKYIEEIAHASKSDFVRMSQKRELIDLSNVIRDEVADFMQLAEKAKLDLRYRPSKGDANLWGDKSKLSRVATNLLSNAVKYTPEGGIIDVTVTSDQNTVALSVSNSGLGLLPEERERIFNRYERLDRHADLEGAGLGLSIVKDIVNLHSGHITVKGEPGKHTEFQVVLPKDLRQKPR